jgi:hypothetical protein
MLNSNRLIVPIAVAEAVAAPNPATAQRQHGAAALGDLMTAFVQPRHIKLGLAGTDQNGPYAAYELDQLGETHADVAEVLPKYRELSIPDMITKTVKEPLAALDQAVKAADGNRFAAAYAQLTAACNACHTRVTIARWIVIQPATASGFPDKDFRPTTK